MACGWRCALAQVFAAPTDGVVFQEPTAECGRACTRREMLESRYCLVPDGGVEGWSLRMYDSLVLGCVPVLIAGAWVGVRLEGTRVSRERDVLRAWTVRRSLWQVFLRYGSRGRCVGRHRRRLGAGVRGASRLQYIFRQNLGGLRQRHHHDR